MATALDILNGARRSLGSIASGETLDTSVANDDLATLNDMLDQWSNSHLMVFCKNEVIHELTANNYIYTVGSGGDIGATFTGSISGTTLTVTALTAGALHVGQILSDAGGNIISGTSITSYGTGRGGNGSSALGTYMLNITQTVSSETVTAYAARPLRINSAFVRVVNSLTGTLDYPIAVIHLEQYELIGIKTLNGPWPRAVYYQPSMPLGILNYWPNPAQGEMHLFCDSVLNRFVTPQDVVTLPQGMVMALRFNLAEMLLPESGKANPEQIAMIESRAKEGRAWIKRTNMTPQQPAQFDWALVAQKRNDPGFILHGGFN